MDSQVDLDVEDLFNEDTSLGQEALDGILPGPVDAVLQSQSVPPPAALVQHVLELHYTGCLKRAAWSRNGHIVRISDDGSKVILQCLRIIPGTDKWKLSEPVFLDRTFEDATTVRWSPSGVELVIIDALGRVFIYCMTLVCLNKLSEIKTDLANVPEEPDPPVALFWLNQDRPDREPRSVVTKFVKTGEEWLATIGRAKAFGPHMSHAFLVLGKTGTLSLFYQRPDTQWRKISLAISNLEHSIVTHGAFASTREGRILLASYCADGRLHVYHIQIEVSIERRPNNEDLANPQLKIEIISLDVPTSHVDPSTMNAGVNQIYDPDSWFLTHLEIVPTSDIENSIQSPPQIWAVLTSIDGSRNVSETGFLQSSVVRRWSVLAVEPSLHPVFAEMPAKSEIHQENQSSFVLDRQVDSYQQVITALDIIEGGQMVAITTIDGQVELWSPITMSPTSFEAQPNEVTSMTQSGLSFNPIPSSILTILSFNACSAIVLGIDEKVTLHQTLYLGQFSQPLSMADPQQSAAASSLILALTRMGFANSPADDVLSCIASACHRDQICPLISRMYSILVRKQELINERAANSQLDRIGQKQMVSKVLSFHLALLSSSGERPLQPNGFPHPCVWSHLWAWLTINIRHSTIWFYSLGREMQQQAQNKSQPLTFPPSYIELVVNKVKYIADICRFILEKILEVGDRQTNPDMFDDPIDSPQFNLGDERGDGSQGLVALLLNCNWSRYLLCNAARTLNSLAAQMAMHAANPQIRLVVDAIKLHSISKGVSLAAIEALFDGRHFVRSGLAEGENYDPAVAAQRQIEMISSGRVGEHFQGTVKTLLSTIINSEKGLRNKGPSLLSRLKLFADSPDMSWILLNMDKAMPPNIARGTRNFSIKEQKFYDVQTKMQITVRPQTGAKMHRGHSNGMTTLTDGDEQLIRRCTRCGSMSEQTNSMRHDWPKTTIPILARCVCDGSWILEPLFSKELKEQEQAGTQAIRNSTLQEVNVLDKSAQ